MENDLIRSSGENTLVTIWIEGKLRSISVSRAAIAAFRKLPPHSAGTLADDACREFVRTNLGMVTAAARNQLLNGDRDADSVVIDAGQAGREEAPGAATVEPATAARATGARSIARSRSTAAGAERH